MSVKDSSVVAQALDFAKVYHAGQLRDEGVPYFTHLVGTVDILQKEADVQESVLLAVAALHDCIEDTQATFDEIKEAFGEEIAKGVLLLSKRKGQVLKEYTAQIFTPETAGSFGLVKLADRLHNLRCLPLTNNPAKIRRKLRETEDYILCYREQYPSLLMERVFEETQRLKKIWDAPERDGKLMYQHKIQYYETDRMGITHHSNYIRIMEEARTAEMEAYDISYDACEKMGLTSPVVNLSCQYRKSTTYADLIEVHTYVIDCERIKLRIGYQMFCRGELIFTGESVHCFLNEKGKPVSLKRDYPKLYEGFKKLPQAPLALD